MEPVMLLVISGSFFMRSGGTDFGIYSTYNAAI
jgi:hypothetical protein